MSYLYMGSILGEMGQFETAKSYGNAGLKIAKELKDQSYQANALCVLGEIYDNNGKAREALPFFKNAMDITVKIADNENHNDDVNNKNAEKAYSILGSAYLKTGQPGKALSTFQKSLPFHKKRMAEDGTYTPNPKHFSQNIGYLNARAGISNAYNDMGKAYLALGNLRKAADCFLYGTKLSPYIYEDPDNAFFMTAVRDSYNGLGKTYLTMGQQEKALQCFQEELKISRFLAQSPWAGWSWRPHIELSTTLFCIGEVDIAMGNKDRARVALEESLNIAHSLNKKYPENPKFENVVKIIQQKLEKTS